MDRPTEGRTDSQADMTKLIVAFRNFANAPKTFTSACFRTADIWEALFDASRVIENTVKVKVKISLQRAMKAHKGSRGIALLFL
jgi:hypothetical protein